MEKSIILVEYEFRKAMADLINAYTDKLTPSQILYSLKDFTAQVQNAVDQQYNMAKEEWEKSQEKEG